MESLDKSLEHIDINPTIYNFSFFIEKIVHIS
jgi:hypothetical protein